MKYTDGLFLDCARKISQVYPEIIFEEMIIDAMSMKLVQTPKDYDVLVMPNLYGDILSDLVAGLVGGLGVVPGANIGANEVIFEPAHGTAPELSSYIANPTAAILSGVMMLRYLGEIKATGRVEKAVAKILKEGKEVTPDLGGNTGTVEYAMAIINAME